MHSDISKCRCSGCPLAKNGKPIATPVLGHGPEDAQVVFVGEAPGRDEVFEGKPFVGPTGQLLRALIDDVKLKAPYYLTNTTLCVPLDDVGKKAPQAAIDACRPRLVDEITRLQARKIIVPLGAFAVKTVLRTSKGITDLEGAIYPSELGRVLPTFHPAAVLRGQEAYFDNIHSALSRVKALVEDGIDPPALDTSKTVTTYHNQDDAIAAIGDILSGVTENTKLSLDLETDGLDYATDRILQIGIYDGVRDRCWVFNYEGRVRLLTGTWGPILPGWSPSAREALRGLLRDRRIEWWLHNSSFDVQHIRFWLGVHHRDMRTNDTMALALGLSEKSQHAGLDKLARRWFNAPAYWDELEKWFLSKKKADRRFSEIPREVLGKYLAHDCIYTWHLIPVLQKAVEVEGTQDLAAMINRYQRLFARMEYRGVGVDLAYAEKLRKTWYPYVIEAQNEMAAAAKALGFDSRPLFKDPAKRKDFGRLNPASPKQLLHLFYNVLKWRQVLNQKRKPTTGKEFIERYKDEPLVQKLVAFRTVKKMMSTYVESPAKLVWPLDGRAHFDILVFGTVTGRLAIQNPPLQVIPKEKRLKVKFDSLRKLFVPLPITFEGDPTIYPSIFIEADYKQLEMRIAWHYSQDPLLGEALMSGDFHRFMASKIFRVPESQVTDEMRHQSKFVTFGILYGRSAFSLAKGELNCDVATAQAFIDAFFKAAPRLHEWWLSQQRTVFDQQFATTTIGRKRRWPLITPKNAQEVRNQSVNFPVQSLASDLNTLSAEVLYDELESRQIGYPLFPVHDAIMFEIRRDRVHEAVPVIERVMCAPPFPTCAKFEIDVSIGPSWGELKKYDPSCDYSR